MKYFYELHAHPSTRMYLIMPQKLLAWLCLSRSFFISWQAGWVCGSMQIKFHKLFLLCCCQCFIIDVDIITMHSILWVIFSVLLLPSSLLHSNKNNCTPLICQLVFHFHIKNSIVLLGKFLCCSFVFCYYIFI